MLMVSLSSARSQEIKTGLTASQVEKAMGHYRLKDTIMRGTLKPRISAIRYATSYRGMAGLYMTIFDANGKTTGFLFHHGSLADFFDGDSSAMSRDSTLANLKPDLVPEDYLTLVRDFSSVYGKGMYAEDDPNDCMHVWKDGKSEIVLVFKKGEMVVSRQSGKKS
jgi:hypothetical protein